LEDDLRRLCAVIAVLAVLALGGQAQAQHNQLDLVSTGPTDGPGDAFVLSNIGFGFSQDGTRVFMTTDIPLVAADTDSADDVYMREGGGTTLLSPGGSNDATYLAGTPDGEHVFFFTSDSLLPADGDAQYDIYEWSAGTLSLVSGRTTGTPGAPTQFAGPPVIPSHDGTRVIFTSWDRLVAEDTDDKIDVYERSGGVTRLLSVGPAGGNGAYENTLHAASDDGSRVFFSTGEALTADDPNTSYDVYRREGNTITRVSQGDFTKFAGITSDGGRFFFTTREALVPADQDVGTCPHVLGCVDVYESTPAGPVLISKASDGTSGTDGDSSWLGISDDGQHILLQSIKQLVPEDTDQKSDIYERTGGTTTLVSTSATAGNGPVRAEFAGATADGSRVFFETTEAMVPSDTNGIADVYERSGGTTTQVSVGPTGTGGSLASISPDGARILFVSANALVPEDTDSYSDLYERFGGKTYLITDFLPAEPSFLSNRYRATPDLSHVFLQTNVALVPADQDSAYDIYEASIGPAVGYPRPKGASPMRVPLVPAFAPCTSPNGTHGAPLAFPSCAPPAQASGFLTVGTDDANGNGQRLIGSVTLKAKVGNPATEVDDADAMITLSMTDIRSAGSLTDYTGEVQGRISIRLTDNGRAAPITNPPQTVQDFPLTFATTCSATANTLIGSTCAVTTTADALVPGMVREDNRAVWELGAIEVYDGGSDGDVDTADNTLFARQGVFIP
jgi:hypothetical protein